jgi:hypothetical protein
MLGQNAEPFNEPAPVTNKAREPNLCAIAGKLASTPGPNRICGKREMEKPVMCMGTFDV